jgi:hypothetical protein
MEGIHMLRDLLKTGDFLVKIDLKDAYLTVTIWKSVPPKISAVSLERHHAGVCMPSYRFGDRAKVFFPSL